MNAIHLVRARDPLTSHLAAQRSHTFAHSHKDRIVRGIRSVTDNGMLGATASEIAAAAGLTVVQVDRRLSELKTEGKTAVLQYEGDDLMRNGFRCWALV